MMKNIWKIAAACTMLVATGTTLQAQTLETVPTYSDGGKTPGKVRVNLMYNYSLPVGSFKNDLIDANSPRGFNADILYSINPKWSAGGAFGYQDYYKKNPRQTYKLADGSDISAVLSHSLQVIPVMAKAAFSPLGGQGHIQPYIAAGAGINVVRFNELLGEFSSLNDNSVHFAAEAGAGIKIPFGSNDRAGFLLGASYRFSPYSKYDISNLNSVNVQAGFQFRLNKD